MFCVCCFRFDVFCVMFAVRFHVNVVCLMFLFDVRYFMSDALCLICLVCGFMADVRCLMFPVRCLVLTVWCMVLSD